MEVLDYGGPLINLPARGRRVGIFTNKTRDTHKHSHNEANERTLKKKKYGNTLYKPTMFYEKSHKF